MARLDVGVGDEFPTEEIHRDENGVVHHHHYYRRRRPFGFLRFVLALLLIGLLVRLFHDTAWMDLDLPWMPHGYFSFVGTLLSIGVVVALLSFLRRGGPGDRCW